METLQAKLRFPEFKGEINNSYKKYSFTDIFLFSTGKNIKQNEASPEFDTLCVRYGELYHMYNEVIAEVINRTNLDKSELIFSTGDEILLPSAGEDPLDIGSASALIVENVAIGRTINILKPLKPNVYSNIYATYFINVRLRKKIAALAKGVSISNVYNSDLKTLDIFLPSLEEQTKIANFLSAVDEKINLLKEKKALLEEYKKGMMQKIFNQEIRFKDDNGNHFEEWEEKSLETIINKIVDNRGKTPPVEKKGIPLLEVNSIGNKKINYNVVSKFVNDVTYDSWFRIYLEKKDVIFSTVGNTALCSFYDDDVKACIAQNLVALRFKNENGLFMYYLLTEKNNNEKFKSIQMGAVQPSVKVSQMIKLIFSVPCIHEQTKIANFLSAIDEKIELVNTQIEDTQEYKKGLLQQMFV